MIKGPVADALGVQAVLAVLVTMGCLVFGSTDLALAAGLVSVVVMADFVVLAFSVKRLFSGEKRGRLAVMAVLALKFPLLIGAFWVALAVLELDPLGAILGASSLVVAVVYASFASAAASSRE